MEGSGRIRDALLSGRSAQGSVADAVTEAATGLQDHINVVAKDMVSGEDLVRNQISNHYLDGLKYGMEGSNGSCLSNYFRYMRNNHDILGICFASKSNPMSKRNKFFMVWNTLTLTFLLSTIFTEMDLTDNFLEALIVALIIVPYSFILFHVAACQICHRQNCCVKWAHRCGCATLLMFSLLSLFYLIGAIIILVHTKSDYRDLIITFGASLLLEQFMPFFLGIFNWIFVSWKGFLCLPQCGCSCLGMRCVSVRFFPLLGLFPIRIVLNAYYLGESTYAEDRDIFKEKYPGRIAIDDVPKDAMDNSVLTSSFSNNSYSRNSAITV